MVYVETKAEGRMSPRLFVRHVRVGVSDSEPTVGAAELQRKDAPGEANVVITLDVFAIVDSPSMAAVYANGEVVSIPARAQLAAVPVSGPGAEFVLGTCGTTVPPCRGDVTKSILAIL